jgi:putative transposase
VIALLKEAALAGSCRIGAFCLMPDHLHLIAMPESDGEALFIFIGRLKGKTTNRSWTLGWRGPLWQRRHHSRSLESLPALEDASRYVIENPVRAALCGSPDDWPWSGIVSDLHTGLPADW